MGRFMLIAIPKEILDGEKRVALIPASIPSLKKAGLDVIVEKGAGKSAFINDKTYVDAGAVLEKNTATLFKKALINAGDVWQLG